MSGDDQLESALDPSDRIVHNGGSLDCASAEEFLAILNPMHEWWQPDPSRWIFRGHGRPWKLLARAHRGKGEFAGLGLGPILNNPTLGDYFILKNAEHALWERFKEALDEAGLPIPHEAPTIERRSGQVLHSGEIPDSGLPLLALAQHFGLPTGLLDWTRQAAKAAYFAAESASRAAPSDERMVVWALRSDVTDVGVFSAHDSFRLVTAPRASNPNLNAQSGLFTQIRDAAENVKTVDEYIRSLHASRPQIETTVPLPWMRRISVSQRCAPRLLQMLSHLGINGSSMFPGYAGVVSRLKEEAIWMSTN